MAKRVVCGVGFPAWRLMMGLAVAGLASVNARAAAELGEETVLRHAAIARRAAAEGMVLLKNDGILPLAPESRIAVFDLSGEYRPGGGGSSNVKAVRISDISSGLSEAGFVIDPGSRETAFLVLGRGSGEGRDNQDGDFDLSGEELGAIAKMKAEGFKKIVAVCNCGHAMNLGPLADDDAVGAILWTWYPGGEGGAAVGDIVSGRVNPSGRLASTFARRVADYPSDATFRGFRGIVPYEDGIFVGYRYFETIPGAKDKVVYPFGHGLSYSEWKIENLKCEVDGARAVAGVRVTNTGKVAGRRSVLCYTSLKGGQAEHPAIELRAYAKTKMLDPGESEELTLSFAKRDLAYFDEDGASGRPGSWVLDKGEYVVLVGGSVRDVAPAGSFTVPVPEVLDTPGFKLKSESLARTLRSDGTYAVREVAYTSRPAGADEKKCRKDPVEKPTVTLYDVADGKASLEQLLDQMTLKEMLYLLHGHPKEDPSGTGSIGALGKFGISAAQTCDGPAGVRRSIKSTYFPCAALLAGTFDVALMYEIGTALGDEASETDFDILLAPGLCIHRHPLCGRNFEYFSEDPLVAGLCASEYVKGVQSRGVGSTLKHFAGNNRESTRKYERDVVGERAFREIYLRGFERAVKTAKPWAIMAAYNGVNGYNCSEHYGLLTGILRGEWGFDGLVMTDWRTLVPLWRETAAGNDVKMPSDLDDLEARNAKEGFGIACAESAESRDYLTEEAVRTSAARVCRLVMKTRRFARERAVNAAKKSVKPAIPDYATLISHRGESIDAPENTLPAYKTAVERGFGFECDIYLSKDGRVFTFHDRDLKRTTGGASSKKCNEATWDELEKMDVGSWGRWKDSKFAGTRPALLEEVLALARDGRWIYVEVKTGPEIVPFVKKIFDAQKTATPRNVLFISFNADSCRELKKQMPGYKVYWLTTARRNGKDGRKPVAAEEILSVLKSTGADGVDCEFDRTVVTEGFVKSVRDAGFEFHVWTVDRIDDMREAFERGVQTVTTNCAKKLLDEYRSGKK